MSEQYQPNIPYSPEAEQAVLGAIMTVPNGFARITNLTTKDFYLLRHQYIWDAMKHLKDTDQAIDYLMVRDRLESKGLLAEIGGVAYLTALVSSVIDSTHLEFYAKIVERTSIRRSIVRQADELKALAMDENLSVDQVLAKSTATTNNLRRPLDARGVSAYDAAKDVFDEIEKRMENPSQLIGEAWSIHGLNRITRGKRKKLYIMAGRPGMGKSSALLSEVLFSCKAGKAVYLNSIEMDMQEITIIMQSMMSGVPVDNIERGDMTDDQRKKFVKAIGDFSKFNLIIDDESYMTPDMLYNRCLDMKHSRGLDEIYVDYLQLMHADHGDTNNRVNDVTAIANGLAEVAKRLQVPLVSAAQLNRGVENRQDKRPNLSDLRDSGGIEQAAYCVIFLYRDDYYNKPEVQSPLSTVELAIAKNRGGPTGMTECAMHLATRQFVNVHRDPARDFSRV